jgi:hypothetical protein
MPSTPSPLTRDALAKLQLWRDRLLAGEPKESVGADIWAWFGTYLKGTSRRFHYIPLEDSSVIGVKTILKETSTGSLAHHTINGRWYGSIERLGPRPVSYSGNFYPTDNPDRWAIKYDAIREGSCMFLSDVFAVSRRLRLAQPPHVVPEIPQSVETDAPAPAPAPVAIPTTLLVKSPDNSLDHNGCITALTWICLIATLLVAYVRLTEPTLDEVSRLLELPGLPLYRLENGPIPNQYLRHTGVWG